MTRYKAGECTTNAVVILIALPPLYTRTIFCAKPFLTNQLSFSQSRNPRLLRTRRFSTVFSRYTDGGRLNRSIPSQRHTQFHKQVSFLRNLLLKCHKHFHFSHMCYMSQHPIFHDVIVLKYLVRSANCEAPCNHLHPPVISSLIC